MLKDKIPNVIRGMRYSGGRVKNTIGGEKWIDPGREYKYLYHGSNKQLTRLDPRPTKVLNGDEAVFATPSQTMALIFIPKWSDADFGLGTHNGRIHIIEHRPNVAKELLSTDGYLHRVSSDGFKHDPRVGMPCMEFVNKDPVYVMDIEYIPNVYEALIASGNVAIITFDEQLELLDPLFAKSNVVINEDGVVLENNITQYE